MSAVIYPSAPSAPAFVNPAQMQNAQAGPSSPPTKKKSPPSAKRKRTDTPEDSNAESATPPRKARDGPKKKKANRACFHCQKAHLTCDDCTYLYLSFYVNSVLLQHGHVSAASNVALQTTVQKDTVKKRNISWTTKNLVRITDFPIQHSSHHVHSQSN